MIDRFEHFVDSGIIQTNFNAIFIDEIQLFDPKWIDICYKLLDKSNGKDFFFEMFGDINQDVKSLRSKGKASWQNTKIVPSLQGRVKKLEKNYRNTDLIAKYLTTMIPVSYTHLDVYKRQPIMLSFLKVYVPKKPENQSQNNEFVKGDIVYNEQFGEGIIVERRGFFKSLVKFKNTGREETILNMHLTKVIEDIIGEDEISDEEINSAFKIIPSNYSDQTCYSTNAKRLMTFLRKKYTGDGIATIKAYPEGDGEIGVLIVPDKGIVVFKMMNQELTAEMLASTMFEPLANNQYSCLLYTSRCV